MTDTVNKYKIRFIHKGKNYVATKVEAKCEQDAIDSVIEQCRLADKANGRFYDPKIVSVVVV